jgi:hypothetical protein
MKPLKKNATYDDLREVPEHFVGAAACEIPGGAMSIMSPSISSTRASSSRMPTSAMR